MLNSYIHTATVGVKGLKMILACLSCYYTPCRKKQAKLFLL